MKPSILYLLITVLCVSQLHAQTVSMSNPSPDAANLGCVTNIPVSLHTGAIKPTIDLFDYTENGFHLCANMSYSMSGARPDLRAGWVGRYWNLRAGGVITRIINGKPDEDINYGYLYHADKLNDLDWAKAYTDEVIKKYRDYFIDMGEHPDEAPDDFYFEANGISGHFFIGKNKEIHVVGQPNIKVEIDFNDRMGTLYYTDTFYRIRIITDDGTVYHYGGREDIIESSQAFLVDGETLPYANAWHLNKITLPNGREVAFEYTELYVDNSFSVSHIYFLSENEVLNFDLSTFSAKNIMRHCYLKSIESDNIKINFNISNFSTNLKNENWKKLDEITIYDKLQNRTVKRFSFNYLNDYLMTLQESGSDSSIVIPPYRFSYNDPIYFDTNEFVFGPKRDVWGYYKEDCNTHFPRTLVDDRGYRYFALAKQPSSRSTKTGILEAIEYPSGGIAEFEYELNDYSRYRYITSSINGLFMIDKAYGDADELKTTQLKNGEILEVTGTVEANVYFVDEGLTQEYSYFTRLTTGKYDRRFFFEQIGLQLPSDVMESYRFMISYKGLSNSMNEKCGGLRIKSIVYKENEDKIVKRADYVYTIGYRNGADLTTEQSSGILGCKPIFEYAFVKGGGNAIWSIPVNTAQLTDGSPVGYSEVTEIISDGQGVQQGYTIYFYSNFDRYPDLGPIYGFTNVAGDTGTRDSQAHKRGKLLRKEIHANDDRLAQSVDYYYKCMNADTVIALKTAVLPAVKSGIVTYLFGSFFVCNKYSVSNLLVKEQRSDYALTPTMKSVDQCIQYKYNEYNQLIEKDVESSDGNHLITRYKYPHDYIDVNSSDKNDIYIKMFDKHIIAPVIEETQYRNSSLVEKTRSEYRFDNEVPYLYSSAKSYDPVSDNFQADVCNTKCDSRGNVLCSILANGLQTVYLWGYNYKYLVAIIENVTLEEVETVLGETSENYAAQSSPDLSKIALLRKELKNSRITSYTYKPCAGVLTETDAAGHTIYYEYDTLGRLISVSDENRNKVNAYEYHHRRITD